jgi:hypothetical protein
MKIKKSLVEQIIKEEAMKIKKLIVLKEEKQHILKQLNELYEGENIEEGVSDAEINAKVAAFSALKNEFGDKFNMLPDVKKRAYAKFKLENPDVKYVVWNPDINNYEERQQTTSQSLASPQFRTQTKGFNYKQTPGGPNYKQESADIFESFNI